MKIDISPLRYGIALLALQLGYATPSAAVEVVGRVRVCASEDVPFRSPAVINLPARASFEESGWSFTGTDLRALTLEEGTMPAPPAKTASFVTTAPTTLTRAHPCADVTARMLLRESRTQVSTAPASTGHIWHLVQVLGYGHWRQPGGLKSLIDDQQIRAVLLTDLGNPVTFTLAQELAADPDMREDVATAQRMAHAPVWPPADPAQEETKVAFSVAWAKRLQGFQTLADLQRLAGSGGMITQRNLNDDIPRVSVHWLSQQTNGREGYMLANVFQNGSIGVGITTLEGISIVVNNKGVFVCDDCTPRIDIEPESAKHFPK